VIVVEAEGFVFVGRPPADCAVAALDFYHLVKVVDGDTVGFTELGVSDAFLVGEFWSTLFLFEFGGLFVRDPAFFWFFAARLAYSSSVEFDFVLGLFASSAFLPWTGFSASFVFEGVDPLLASLAFDVFVAWSRACGAFASVGVKFQVLEFFLFATRANFVTSICQTPLAEIICYQLSRKTATVTDGAVFFVLVSPVFWSFVFAVWLTFHAIPRSIAEFVEIAWWQFFKQFYVFV
jgi:hypothetical protein